MDYSAACTHQAAAGETEATVSSAARPRMSFPFTPDAVQATGERACGRDRHVVNLAREALRQHRELLSKTWQGPCIKWSEEEEG